MERIAASAADPDQPDFDAEAELQALERQGYVFPAPLTRRVLAVARAVDELGWDGAQAVLEEEWRGVEAEVLAEALPVALAHWRAQERLADRRWLARLLGGRR